MASSEAPAADVDDDPGDGRREVIGGIAATQYQDASCLRVVLVVSLLCVQHLLGRTKAASVEGSS